MINQIADWLDSQPNTSYPMQRDGHYALMTWKDLRRCSTEKEIGFQQIVWVLLMAIGLPLVIAGQ